MSCTVVIKDKNLKPENIKKDVTILKVKGTLEGSKTVTLQSKTVDSSTEKQTVTYDSSYDGLSSVTVEAYELDAKTVNSSTSQQVITSDKDGLSSVTVNPYKLQNKTVDSSSAGQIVTPDQNYNGLSQVTVNGIAIINGVEETFDENGQFVIYASDYDARGISDITINVSVEGSSDSSVYQYVFGITQSPDMRSMAPRCIMTDHVIDNANFVGMSGYIAAPYSQNPYWVFGVDCDVQSRAAAPMFGIYVDGDDMTFYFGETAGLTVTNDDTDFQSGAYFNVYEDPETGDHIVEVNGVAYDYEEETGLGWMSNTVSNELYIFARNANGTAYSIAPEGTFFKYLYLNYDDGDSSYTYGFDAAIEGYISESGWFEGSAPVLYYNDDGDEGIIQMPSGYSYNVISMGDTIIDDVIDLSEGGDSELVMFDPVNEGRPAGVIIPVAGSGGSDWVLEAKADTITDLSLYELDQPAKNYMYCNFLRNCTIEKLPDTSHWTSIAGTSACQDMFKDSSTSNSGDKIANFSSLTTISGSNCVKGMLLGSKITELWLPNLETIDGGSGLPDIIGQAEASTLKTLKINVAVAQPYGMTGALTASQYLAGVENIEMTGMARYNLNFTYMTNLTADSVLNILTHLGTPYTTKYVNFASGLTVTDYPDGRIQAAYDAAIATSVWSIYNLTITPYS